VITIKKAVAIELQKVKLEPDECLFVKVDINLFSLKDANEICEFIQSLVPSGVKVIGYPGPGVDLQVVKKL
jgi:hypothetical protein